MKYKAQYITVLSNSSSNFPQDGFSWRVDFGGRSGRVKTWKHNCSRMRATLKFQVAISDAMAVSVHARTRTLIHDST